MKLDLKKKEQIEPIWRSGRYQLFNGCRNTIFVIVVSGPLPSEIVRAPRMRSLRGTLNVRR
jgi:hypothetical protein